MTQAVQTAQYGSSTVGLGFKNRLINGSMDIWQRGTSFTGVGSIVYYADRWCGIQYAGSTSTITRATGIGLSGFQYALRAQRPAASSDLNSINVGQSVESQNCLDIAGKQVTFSFWARAGSNFSAASSILLSQITTGTGTDQNVYGTYTGASTTNQNNTISTSWARFSQTITVPSNATEIAVSFNYTPTGTAGSNDFYEITGCQLEIGSNATSFDTLSIGTQLDLCQRYYQQNKAALSTGDGATGIRGMIPLLVQMRTSSLTLGKTSGNFFFGDMVSIGSTSTSTPIINETDNNLQVSFTLGGFTGLTTYRTYKHEVTSGNPAIFTISGEL
jgi:hypothetical protein